MHEWGKVPISENGHERSIARSDANALLEAARRHPCADTDGANILVDCHRYIRAQQFVGILATPTCSLEILPKVDPDGSGEDFSTVRARLVQMLDAVLGLRLSPGENAAISRQSASLLDILIKLFADRLAGEVRRGLPRQYVSHEEDLKALRGQLNVTRQITAHAVRPDRLACRFDVLTADVPLLRVMKACVVFLARYARSAEIHRCLNELRLAMADVADVAVSHLQWGPIGIDRTNMRWESLLAFARLFLKSNWQSTHHDTRGDFGISLLFPMNQLFEAYIAVQLRRAFATTGIEIVTQGGLQYCLGEWIENTVCNGTVFQTRPDILLRKHGQVILIIDTKWKALSANPLDRKQGLLQSDVYQMMAYARAYGCRNLMLLYPALPGAGSRIRREFGLHAGTERLSLGCIDVSTDRRTNLAAITALIGPLLSTTASTSV